MPASMSMALSNHRLFLYPDVTVTQKTTISIGTYENKILSCMRACVYAYKKDRPIENPVTR